MIEKTKDLCGIICWLSFMRQESHICNTSLGSRMHKQVLELIRKNGIFSSHMRNYQTHGFLLDFN